MKILITHDFIMELLSQSKNVKVLKPASLAKKMEQEQEKSLNRCGN